MSDPQNSTKERYLRKITQVFVQETNACGEAMHFMVAPGT